MKCINSIQHHLSWQTVIHRQQHNQISHHQIPLKHQHPVFWVGLIDLPITNWGIYCSQGVHMMQSHESLNLDNNLTLHVQYVAIPRDNGRARVAVNMWTNILLKGCVLTTVAQHNHIPCFGYALVLAINRLFTDLTGVQYLAQMKLGKCMFQDFRSTIRTRWLYPILFVSPLSLPQNSKVIVVDTKDRTKN